MRKLYYYPLCAFSRTALLSLSEKKLDFSIEITRFWDKNSPLLELNSFGRLPVLVDLNGSIISGVYAIIEYLEDAYDNTKLLGQDLAERAEARRIFQWMNEDFASEITTQLVFEKDIKRYFPQSSPSSSLIKQ
ncbi:MAG: glutathione S-transferase family protein, partial [Holosporales bacterium]|nr:glutathione S-transferase family protein [Holosporales bacterium]